MFNKELWTGAPGLTQGGCKTVPDVFGSSAQGIDFEVRIPSGCRLADPQDRHSTVEFIRYAQSLTLANAVASI